MPVTCSEITFPTIHLYLQQMNIHSTKVNKITKNTFGKYVYAYTNWITAFHFCVCIQWKWHRVPTLGVSAITWQEGVTHLTRDALPIRHNAFKQSLTTSESLITIISNTLTQAERRNDFHLACETRKGTGKIKFVCYTSQFS